MASMAETAGPVSRCRLLAEAFKEKGIKVASCMAEDVNFRRIHGVKNYAPDVPMPLGLPSVIAKRSFPLAQKLGLTSRVAVHSFDKVLQITGNLSYSYLRKSVARIEAAIDEFRPDLVYSEFSIPAIIAAKHKGVRLAATVSYPTQYEYANEPRYAKGLNRLLKELSMETLPSALKLFELADLRFCPSIAALEPFDKEKVVFCGTLNRPVTEKKTRKRILVYMGNGSIPAAKCAEVLKEAFAETRYEIYFATSYLEEKTDGKLHIAARWDFASMLDETVLFINHGGQNSMMDGLVHGVPQIVIPGKVFERRYNAAKLKENGAGIVLSEENFVPDKLFDLALKVITSRKMRRNAEKLGKELLKAGGAELVAELIKKDLKEVLKKGGQ